MWRPQNSRRRSLVGSSPNNNVIPRSTRSREAGLSSSSSSSGRRLTAASSHVVSSRKNRTKNSMSSLLSSLHWGGSDHKRSAINKSDWNLVAHEIENMIYGDGSNDEYQGNEEERESECSLRGDGADRRSRKTFSTSSLSSSSRNSIDIQIGSQRRQIFGNSNSTNSHTVTNITTSNVYNDNINSYNLFDDHHETSIRNATKKTPASSIIIYAQKYCYPPGSLFALIYLFLSGTSILLLMIRVVMSLLTATVGTFLVVFLVGWFLREFSVRPIRLIRMVHSSPVLVLACFGAVSGTLHALWYQKQYRILPLLSSLITNTTTITMDHSSQQLYLTWWLEFILGNDNESGGIPTNDNYSIDNSSYIDLVMLWGLIKGFIIGVEVGSVWLIMLGDISNPSNLTKIIHRYFWRPSRQYYREATISRRTRRFLASSYVVGPAPTTDTDTDTTTKAVTESLTEPEKNDRQKCVICLENFSSEVKEQQDNGRFSADYSRFQMLPCLHSFHRDCALHWLLIQNKCPICRVPVRELQCYELGGNENEMSPF